MPKPTSSGPESVPALPLAPAAPDRLRLQADFLQSCTRNGINRHNFPTVRQAVREVDAILRERRETVDVWAPEEQRDRALLSEYFEYFGEFDRAREILSVYESAYGRDAPSSAVRMPRLCVWFANVLYRERHLHAARERIEEAEAGYASKGDRFGLGFAHFYRARIEHRGASSKRARELAHQALDDFKNVPGLRPAFRVGICHVLIAWIAYWGESWREADAHLAQAEDNLKDPDTDDPIHLGRVAFMRGCLRRASARTPDEFSTVLDQFAHAINDFSTSEHGPFLAAAYNNRGLTFTQRWLKGDKETATKSDKDLAFEDFEAALRVSRLDARARVENTYFRARWCLRDDKAVPAARLAIRALTAAGELGTLQAEVRVLLARALLRIRDFRASVRDDLLETARRKRQRISRKIKKLDEKIDGELKVARSLVLGRRRRTEVACWLVQAEHEYRSLPQDLSLARGSLLKARAQMRGLDHLFLSGWADDVERQITWAEGGLYLGLHSPSLDYRATHERLKVWLVRSAIDRVGDRASGSARRGDVAQQIGVPRQILERWLHRWKEGDDIGEPDALRGILRALRSRKRPS